jgi:hypothetical protein
MSANTAKAVLVSFPKSGSNWVRYCIEFFSGAPTPGGSRQLLVTEGEPIIDRHHFLDKRDRTAYLAHTRNDRRTAREKLPNVDLLRPLRLLRGYRKRQKMIASRRLILLIRDPFALYVRQGATSPIALRGYFTNIRVFDKARQDKCLVYYEDMIRDFGEVERILEFLEIDFSRIGFDVEEHRQRSLALYVTATDRPRTRESLDAFDYHSRRLSPQQARELRKFGEQQIGRPLYEKYLGRYDRPPSSSSPSAADGRGLVGQ